MEKSDFNKVNVLFMFIILEFDIKQEVGQFKRTGKRYEKKLVQNEWSTFHSCDFYLYFHYSENNINKNMSQKRKRIISFQ